MIKENRFISITVYNILIEEMANVLKYHGYNKIYGVPKNGSIIAESLTKHGLINTNLAECDCIVDDLIDSGKTKAKHDDKPFYVLLTKRPGEWVSFWFEKPVEDDMENLVTRQIEIIGEDPKRLGLQDTPKRVAKMFKETFRGYDKSQKPAVTTFRNGADNLVYDQMIIDEGDFYSHCEHHMVPFYGQYFFAYIAHPKGKILGLSKVARIVDYYSARLQVQERLVSQIVEELWNALDDEYPPLGMAIVMRGRHLCKEMRGAKKKGVMTCIELKGVFRDKPDTRMEFLNFVNMSGGK